MPNHRISVEIPEDLHRKLKIKAYTIVGTDGKSKTIKEVVTQIISEWVEKE